MKGFIPILCCALMIIGGGMLMAPAGTIDVPVFYEVQPVAMPAPGATHTNVDPVVANDAADPFSAVGSTGNQLAALTRPSGAGTGCATGNCPYTPQYDTKTETVTRATTAVTEESENADDGARRNRPILGAPVRACRGVVGGAVRCVGQLLFRRR